MLDINRGKSESIKEYENRLATNREAYKLSWLDVANLINAESGDHYSCDTYRKRYSKGLSREVNAYLDTSVCTPVELETEQNLLDITTEQIFEIQKERQKLQLERTQINALIKRASREETLKEIAHDVASAMSAKLRLTGFPIIKTINSEKIGILQLSDVHYGLEDKTLWNEYNTEIAKKRLQKLQNKVIEYIKKENITTLYLINLGDMICGRIHLQLRLNSSIDVVTQSMEISEILSEFTNNLSKYAVVHCYYTTDNHSRLEPNIKDSMDLETLSRIIPWYMKERLKNNNNIVFHINDSYCDDIVTFKVFNYTIAACHGHKDKPGKIVQNLSLYTKTHYDLILSSHFHHTALEETNETVVVYNGSVVSTDTFAEKLRLNSKPSQNLIVCTPDNVVECLYKINLD